MQRIYPELVEGKRIKALKTEIVQKNGVPYLPAFGVKARHRALHVNPISGHEGVPLLLCQIRLCGYFVVFPSVRLSSTANSGEKTAKNGQKCILFHEKILKTASTPLLLRIIDSISIY